MIEHNGCKSVHKNTVSAFPKTAPPTQSGEKLTNPPPKFDTSLSYFLNGSFPDHHPQMNFMYPENLKGKKKEEEEKISINTKKENKPKKFRLETPNMVEIHVRRVLV